MIRNPHHRPATLWPVALAAALLAAPIAQADSLDGAPAAIADSGDAQAHSSFNRFAVGWMEKMHRVEANEKRNPTVRPGAQSPLVTYRGYDDDFKTELRPTGQPVAPYVGILRYTERVYSCATVLAESCTVASRIPVTEIFRMQGGRWVY